MEPNDFNHPIRSWPKHRQGVKDDGQKVTLAYFLHVNTLNPFQRLVIPLFMEVDHTQTSVQRAMAAIDEHVAALTQAGWTPERRKGDMVDRPEHYTAFPIEPTFFNMENGIDWCRGNALKYICRYRFKNGIEDLRKALRYLTMYLAYANGEQEWSK